MKARIAALVAISAVVATGLAAPAHAYDDKAYAYAAGHMIQRSDIPKVLGKFRNTMAFNAYAPDDAISMCSLQQPGDTPSTEVNFPVGTYEFNANYNAGGAGAPSLASFVYQYSTTGNAIAAFHKATTQAKRCAGQHSSSWTDPDSGSVSTYTTVTTNGVVPAVQTAGVKSVFVNVNSEAASTGAGPYQTDQYQVFSLIDDVVIVTLYNMNSADNVTTSQRKAVNQVAFNAETAWLN